MNSYEWPRLNFSLQYLCRVKQTSNENKVKYQLGDYHLIQYQVLQSSIVRIVWQTVGRITNRILGVKGLSVSCLFITTCEGYVFMKFLICLISTGNKSNASEKSVTSGKWKFFYCFFSSCYFSDRPKCNNIVIEKSKCIKLKRKKPNRN